MPSSRKIVLFFCSGFIRGKLFRRLGYIDAFPGISAPSGTRISRQFEWRELIWVASFSKS
jgi:hypothetical protein